MIDDIRITARLNAEEQAQLELFKQTFHIENDSEALKLGMKWCNHYLKNVTDSFFPPGYDVILSKKRKTAPLDRKVYE